MICLWRFLFFFLKALSFQWSLDGGSRAEEPQDTEIQLKQSVEPSLAPERRSAAAKADRRQRSGLAPLLRTEFPNSELII